MTTPNDLQADPDLDSCTRVAPVVPLGPESLRARALDHLRVAADLLTQAGDETQICIVCHDRFTVEANAQLWFCLKGLPIPRRCPACRAANRQPHWRAGQ